MNKIEKYRCSINRVKLVSFIIALFPLISSYRSGIPGVDLGTAAVLAAETAFVLCDGNKLFICDKKRIIIYIYVICFSFISFFSINETADYQYTSVILSIARMFKFVLVMFAVFRTKMIQYFDEGLAIKYTRHCVYINSIMIVFQQLAYRSGVVVNNPLEYFYQEESYIGRSVLLGSYARPSGFFLEPSHYAEFFIVFLCYVLFCESKNNKKIMDYLMVLIGAVMSGSTIGIAEVTGLGLLSGCINLRKHGKKSMIFLVCIVLMAAFSVRLPIVQLLIDRLRSGGAGYGGNIIKARIGNGFEIFQSLPLYHKLFGTGYGHTPLGGSAAYLNGMTYILNTLGIAGTAVFGFVYIRLFRHNQQWKQMLLISFGILMTGAQMFTVSAMVQIFAFVEKGNSLVRKKEYGMWQSDRFRYFEL